MVSKAEDVPAVLDVRQDVLSYLLRVAYALLLVGRLACLGRGDAEDIALEVVGLDPLGIVVASGVDEMEQGVLVELVKVDVCRGAVGERAYEFVVSQNASNLLTMLLKVIMPGLVLVVGLACG